MSAENNKFISWKFFKNSRLTNIHDYRDKRFPVKINHRINFLIFIFHSFNKYFPTEIKIKNNGSNVKKLCIVNHVIVIVINFQMYFPFFFFLKPQECFFDRFEKHGCQFFDSKKGKQETTREVSNFFARPCVFNTKHCYLSESSMEDRTGCAEGEENQ